FFLIPPPPRPPPFPSTTLFRSHEPRRAAARGAFGVVQHGPESAGRELVEPRRRLGQPQQAFRREEDEGSQLGVARLAAQQMKVLDRKSTRLNSSHVAISYAVFC